MAHPNVRTSCVICTRPRSGSWLLAEALNNTGLVGQPEEYFRPDHMHLWRERWSLDRDSSFDRFVDAAIDDSTTDNGVFSFKMHWYQFEWFAQELRALEGTEGPPDAELVARWVPNPRFVYLIRHDKARQAISYWRAGRSQVWFVVEDGAEGVAGGVDPALPGYSNEEDDSDDEHPDFARIKWLERLLVRHERCWLAYFESQRIRPLTVVYEQFASDYYGTVARILDWLGVAPPEGIEIPAPGLRRQADDVTETLLEQYMAVRDTL
jgi:trehalose 2-sulfotransferase